MKRAVIKKFRSAEGTGSIGYLNIAGDRSIPTAGIVGIFDMDRATVSSVTREFLRKSERQGQTVTVKASLPKAFILYEDGLRETVFFSPLAVSTLAGRENEK